MPSAHSTQKKSLNTAENRLAKWIQQLRSEDLDILNEAVQQLIAHKETALPLLLSALSEAEEEIRKNVTWVLGFIQQAEAIPILYKAMNTDSSMDVKLGASWALRQYPIKSLTPLVFTKLTPPNSFEDIAEYLESKSWKARWYSSIFLAQHLTPNLFESLKKLVMEDDNILVRCSAILSIVAYDAPEIPKLLCELLSDFDKYVKIEAASMIGLTGYQKAVPILAKLLDAYDQNVRVAATTAIGTLGNAGTIPHLAKALKDSSSLVRINAAIALFDLAQKINDKQKNIAELCLKAIRDENVYVVKNAARTLGIVGDEDTLRYIISLLKEEKRPEITSNLVQALGMFKDPRALKILGKLLQHPEWEVRFEVVGALSLIGRQAERKVYNLLIHALRDNSLMVKEQAVRALGQLGNTKAIAPLEKMKMKHPYGIVNRSISKALDRLLGI